jgi:hypothetical protein
MSAKLRGLRLGYAAVTPETRVVTWVTRKSGILLSHACACARSIFHAIYACACIRKSANRRFPRNPRNYAGLRRNLRVTAA